MDTTIDSLQIEISVNSPRVVTKLEKIKDALEALSTISESIKPMDTRAVDMLETMARSVAVFADSAGTAKFGKAVAHLKELSSFSAPKMDGDFTTTLKPIDREVIRSISGTAIATQKLADGAGTAKFGKAIAQIRELSELEIPEMPNLSDLVAVGTLGPELSGALTEVNKYTEAQQELAVVQEEVKATTVETTGAVEDLRRQFDDFTKQSGKVEEATEAVGNEIKKVGIKSTKSSGKVKDFLNSVMRIAKYRAIRNIIRQISEAFREGVQNMYEYSVLAGTSFAPAMDKISSSALYFKNSIGAMVAPLLEALAPAIETVVDHLVNFLNILNQVISALMGKTTWTKAISVPVKYGREAKAATRATKELRNAILGIDEINILEGKRGAGGGLSFGGGLDFSEMFEELPIEQKFKDLADLLRDIWDIAKWIGVAFLGWKIASGVVSALKVIGGLFGIASPLGGGGKSLVKTTLEGIASLAIIVGGLGALVIAIGELTKIPGFNDVVDDGLAAVQKLFKGLWEIAGPLAVYSVGIIGLGKIGVRDVLQGVGGLASIIGGLEVLMVAIGGFISIKLPGDMTFADFADTGVKQVVSTLNGIWEIAGKLGAISAGIVGLGLAGAATVMEGVLAMVGIVLGLEVLIVAIGGLTNIPGWNEHSIKGATELGEVFGTLAGTFTKTLADKTGEALVGMADNVTAFMQKIQPAIELLKEVDETALTGMAVVGETLMAAFTLSMIKVQSMKTTGQRMAEFSMYYKFFGENIKGINIESVKAAGDMANVIVGLMRIQLSNDKATSMRKFGAMLPEFGNNIKQYGDNIAGTNTSAIEETKSAVSIITELVKDFPGKGGLLQYIMGETDMESWSTKLPEFAKAMVGYSKIIAQMETGAVEATNGAVSTVIAFSRQIPKSGGLIERMVGSNDIKKWGDKLPGFAKAMVTYAKIMTNLDVEVVKATSTAVDTVVEFTRKIPTTGGLFGLIIGNNDVSVWGDKLVKFGQSFVAYYNHMKNIDTSVVTASTNAAKSVLAFTDSVPKTGGLLGFFSGSSNLASYGEQLKEFGKNFKSYYNSIKDLDFTILGSVSNTVSRMMDLSARVKTEGLTSELTKFATAISKLAKSILSIPSSKSFSLDVNYTTGVTSDKQKLYKALELPGWPSMQWKSYAEGGWPDIGQFFFARESGPELVGTIGGKTAVMNNDQIVESVARGVANANNEQNQLLKEQNELLRKLLTKDSTVKAVVSTTEIVDGLSRRNRRDGREFIPVGG